MAHAKKIKFKRSPPFLREWRKFKEEKLGRRITQAEIAEIFKVNRTTVGRIENGELQYNQDRIEKLAIFYKQEIWEIMTINPYAPNVTLVMFGKLQAAPKETQDRAVMVLEALLKVG